ncbi:MAG: NAD(P)H-binding protein [Aquaticitalea sp.]
MQITILGSTGQVGKAVLIKALNSGYQVKVLVRTPEKLDALKEKVEIVKGDLLDALSVEKALYGSKVVINAAGGVKEPDQFKKFQQIGKILGEKMKKQGITRLISISGAVSTLPGEKLDFKRKIMKIFVGLFYNQMKQAQDALLPTIVELKYIDWTFVRAAMISKNPGTGEVLADDKKMPGTKIMLEDLGQFIVEQITSTDWIKKAPLVASKIS